MSVTGSNEVPLLLEDGTTKKGKTRGKAKGCKRRVKSKAFEQETPPATKRKGSIIAPASPAMSTRSKAGTTSSPAMGTRSKVATAHNAATGSKRKLYC